VKGPLSCAILVIIKLVVIIKRFIFFRLTRSDLFDANASVQFDRHSSRSLIRRHRLAGGWCGGGIVKEGFSQT
jgi:hypothetical protein